ncbi:ion transporter [Thermomonas haemolytica]|uniref:Voltage-gated potassium channel n=1 Tax=Thermomonas haemolytica TaxID=141949 RepID=A0A4R3N560_9GAMM|nr:ion transporter [Thermomonas haemolytica]TCT21899.1 voltage-gated potassium channel [Thermomonas haemolytica]TNY29832.1 ion transporter [Thermomonas haemolytica]
MAGPAHREGEPRSLFEREHWPASTEGRRYRWYRVVFHHDSPAERNFDLLLIVAILASVLVVVLDSVPGIKARWHLPLYVAEWVFTVLFASEYAVRLWVVRNPWRYARSFYGVIDLLAILPTLLSLLFPASTSLAVIRALRLLRIFRVLKLVEYSSEAGMLMQALWRSRRKILVFLATVLTVVVVFGALMYLVEGPANGFTSIPTAMYWAVVTMATVGFGDIAPHTALGRFIASVLILIGYSIIAAPTGIYTAELARSLQPRRLRARCPQCGLPEHEADAWYCRKCGHALPSSE